MRIYQEISLRDFEFWSGAKDTAAELTPEQLDQMEDILEETAPEEGYTDTTINDIFRFESQWIHEMLGIVDEEDLECWWKELDTSDKNDVYDEASNLEEWIEDNMESPEDWLDEDGYIIEGKEDEAEHLYEDAMNEWWNNLDLEDKQEYYKENN